MKFRADTWKQKCDAVATLRAFALIAVAGGLIFLGLSFVGHPGGHDLTGFRGIGLTLAVLGAAAIFARKSTAVLFSLMCISFAAFFIMLCFAAPPAPAMIIPVLFAWLCCLPVLLTFRGWEALK